MKKTSLPKSEHFQLTQLHDGVYAAIASEGGGAFSNAGIVDLGDRTVIFDTFETPKAAIDLRNAAETLTGRKCSFVIISHAHDDHWMGNQVFADHATIVATPETRELMMKSSIEILEDQRDNSKLVKLIRETEERLQKATDDIQKRTLRTSLSRWQHTLEALPTLTLHFPHATFQGRLTIFGTNRSVEVLATGKGHTISDCSLYLVPEKIAFIGDLGFFQTQPFMAFCDPKAWVAHLEALEQSNIQTFVPGHGPLGTKEDLVLQREYILLLEDVVSKVIKGGGSLEDALQIELPPPYDGWVRANPMRFETNIRSSYQRQRKSQ